MDKVSKIFIEVVGDPALALGSELLSNYVSKIGNSYSWISIGSSDGAIECVLEEKINTKFICVDPNPLDYSVTLKLYLPPLYKNVDELIAKQPSLVNNCNLLIIRSFPIKLDDDRKAYDYVALMKLNPLNLMVVCEVDDSPSEALRNFIINPIGYNRVSETKCFFQGFDGNPVIDECYWFSRELGRGSSLDRELGRGWHDCPQVVPISKEKIIAHYK